MRNVGAEIATHDAMPSGVVFLVELLLDVAGDVLLDVVLLQGLRRAVNGILITDEKVKRMSHEVNRLM